MADAVPDGDDYVQHGADNGNNVEDAAAGGKAAEADAAAAVAAAAAVDASSSAGGGPAGAGGAAGGGAGADGTAVDSGAGAGAGAGAAMMAPTPVHDNMVELGATSSGDVAVTFNVTDGNYTHVIGFPVQTSIAEVKKTLQSDLRLPVQHLVLRINGVVKHNQQTLHEIGFEAGMQGCYMDVFVDPTQTGGDYRMPDVLKVEVYDEETGEARLVLVGIERDEARKLYLGGYRHKKTGAIYHHAACQTTFERTNKWEGMPERFTRETQTVDLITRSAQTIREAGTQMKRRDLYVDESKDREISPKDYFDSEQLAKLREDKTLYLQCQWRGYVARKTAWELREGAMQKREQQARDEETKRVEAEAKHNAEIRRRMHPRSVEDFEILYNELESWRVHETKRIEESGLPEIERLEALAQLLHKETKLLQTIDRLKITANGENREKRIKRMLELMAEPKKWELHDGDIAQVHTPFSTRAKELMELFNGLNLPMLTIDERLDVLLHVKWTVKEFDCALTREIVDLIDREADLLNRGRSEKSLEGLRKRISNLFLQFIETPEFNPEAARFQKVPRSLDTRPKVKPIINERTATLVV